MKQVPLPPSFAWMAPTDVSSCGSDLRHRLDYFDSTPW